MLSEVALNQSLQNRTYHNYKIRNWYGSMSMTSVHELYVIQCEDEAIRCAPFILPPIAFVCIPCLFVLGRGLIQNEYISHWYPRVILFQPLFTSAQNVVACYL